mmetsp:Transcript_103101/g.298216  ORF Transcript_103101/g.298216 Transcript_103101/m.298216 type:complete len:207 (-) Transcript_103101:624-1244(-)
MPAAAAAATGGALGCASCAVPAPGGTCAGRRRGDHQPAVEAALPARCVLRGRPRHDPLPGSLALHGHTRLGPVGVILGGGAREEGIDHRRHPRRRVVHHGVADEHSGLRRGGPRAVPCAAFGVPGRVDARSHSRAWRVELPCAADGQALAGADRARAGLDRSGHRSLAPVAGKGEGRLLQRGRRKAREGPCRIGPPRALVRRAPGS